MSVQHFPKYKIILNIDGIKKIYDDNNTLKYNEFNFNSIESYVKGGNNTIIRPFKEIYKFGHVNDEFKYNICYIINCYCINKGNEYVLNEENSIILEITNIYNMYNTYIHKFEYEDIEALKLIINNLCNFIINNYDTNTILNEFNTDNIKEFLNKFNLEILITDINGGISNNRNKFILNKDKICEKHEQVYKYPWILMLDDSDFCGFKNVNNEQYIEKTIDKIWNNNNIWSFGTPSKDKGPGNISFWERIYKTEKLNSFLNLAGDITDDGLNKIYSLDYKRNSIDKCFNINQNKNILLKDKLYNTSHRWCNYGTTGDTTIHLNPAPVSIYNNSLITPIIYLNELENLGENINNKFIFIYNDDIINYILDYYYVLIINTEIYEELKNKDELDVLLRMSSHSMYYNIKINDNKLFENDILVKLNDKDTNKIDGQVFYNTRNGMYGNTMNHIKQLLHNSNFSIFIYPKKLYSKASYDKTTLQSVNFKKLKYNLDNIYYKDDINVLHVFNKDNMINCENYKTTYIVKKYKNYVKLLSDKKSFMDNPTYDSFKSYGSGINYCINYKIFMLLLVLIIILIIVIIIKLTNKFFIKSNYE